MVLNLPRNSTNYVISGTDTFRLGSRMLTTKLVRPRRLGQVGANLQNIEKSARVIYIPDDGYEFTQVDQAGAEALIVAYLCRHANFRNLFLNNIKSHCYVALHVFAKVWQKELEHSGINVKELTELPVGQLTSSPYWKSVDKVIRQSDKWPAERRYYYISKQICHASNYGMKAGMFQLNTLEKSKGRIVISKQEAEYYLETYHCLFPEIHEWHRAVEAQLLETRTLYNLFGHPRFFWYPAKEPPYDVMKKAYAFVPQSTVGMITRLAFTDMQTHIEKHNLDWHLMQDNHDSYLVMHPVGTSNEVIPVMQQFINREMTAPDGTKFCMKSEAQTGNNWSPASDKNEKGLRDI